MKLTITNRINSKARPVITWVEPGTYEVVRFFDHDRAIIDVTGAAGEQRQITIVPINAGMLAYDEKTTPDSSEA